MNVGVQAFLPGFEEAVMFGPTALGWSAASGGAIRAERAWRASLASEAITSRIARRRAEDEGVDALFVGERRRSRLLPGAIHAERARRARQSNTVPPMGFEPMLERV